MTKLENALVWLYVKTWGRFGEHVIQENIWNFSANDLEKAIMGLAFPRKKEMTERVKALTDLIMGKFENGGLDAFRKWAGEIHDEVIETLPETAELDPVDNQMTTFQRQQQTLVKILKWDLGKYSRTASILKIQDLTFELKLPYIKNPRRIVSLN